jgi:phenylacetate-CoA ligase
MSIVEQLFIDSLRRSQWLTPRGLQRYQQPLLDRLVRHAAMQTSFYADRLAPLFGGRDPEQAPIDFARWPEIPVVTRAQAFDNGEAMKAKVTPPDAGKAVSGQSSGSTGIPLKHLRSELADLAANCQLDRVYELFDFDLFGSMAFIGVDFEENFPYPHGMIGSRWNRTSPEAKFFALDIKASPAEQLEWLQRVQPDHVFSYPSNLLALAEAALACGSSLRFKRALATGEMLRPEVRDRVARAFGCGTVDVYGAKEIGQIAFECPDGTGYHCCSDIVLCEIVDDDGQPVIAGAAGRVVVTPFYNYAMPFIRYDVGDYAVAASAACTCGRGLLFLDRITGRRRNLFVMPEGTRKWPATDAIAMLKFLPFRQYQIIQIDQNTIEFRYIPVDPAAAPQSVGLVEYFRNVFHSSLDVRLVAVDRIDPNAAHKFEQFISRVNS